jgi:hypothetical protein
VARVPAYLLETEAPATQLALLRRLPQVGDRVVYLRQEHAARYAALAVAAGAPVVPPPPNPHPLPWQQYPDLGSGCTIQR